MNSQKHHDFVNEPMKDKPIDAIAGISPRALEILSSKGFDKAYHLLGLYLLMSQDAVIFDEWLKSEVDSLSVRHRGDTIVCLKEWCDKNL